MTWKINTGEFAAKNKSIEAGIHYHICWSNSSLDWKPFPTKEEATIVAKSIKKPNENYIIVERDDDCERCEEFKSKADVTSLSPLRLFGG